MKLKKFAAIDVGSNAIRVLISNIIESKEGVYFQKNALVRAPIRLGEDSFTLGEISKKNIKRMVKAMRAFKLLMKVHGVSHYQAFATSALREANNSIEVIDHVKKKAGIKIEIIDGRKEAEVISYSKLSEFLNSQKTFLFVDVGGGSTEFTIIDEGKRISSKSFKIGTVRLINDLVDDRVWKAIQGWIEKNAKPYRKITLIGSGGNINKLFKLSNIKEGKPLSLIKLNQIYLELESLTYEERLLKFELNPDRADVIIPAAKIYLKSLEWSGGQKIYVPKFGLSDGMIKYMYKNGKKKI
ncbi:MAG: exopolyphosphatase [Flavobacteriaceae bacterium]|nr:exopolyphosphatase [Flavobacteriaceae bacterium]MDG1968121.1 exopolyphosphatase [Flavobacteriaceae bacterium]HCZ10003.1 exopolyphosphatase [Flavobacteriaceae bacterium]